MARPKKEDTPEGYEIEPDTSGQHVRVRITHYKVKTSQGRFLENDLAWLPAQEAESLLKSGMAVAA